MLENELLYHCWAYAILAGAGGVIALGLWFKLRRATAGRWLPLPRRATGRWSGYEVFLVFLFFLLSAPAIQSLLEQLGFFEAIYGRPPSTARKQLWVWLLATPLFVAGVFLILHALSRTRPSRYGMTPVRAVPNAILGYLVWLVLTPVVLTVFFLAIQGMSADQLQQHPLERLGREKVPLWPVEWALVAFQAVIAAPLVEELVFRGILLGWLRRATLVGHGVVASGALLCGVLAMIGPRFPETGPPGELKYEPFLFVLALVPVYLIPAWVLETRRSENEARGRLALPPASDLWNSQPGAETGVQPAGAVSGIQTPGAVSEQPPDTAISTSPTRFGRPLPLVRIREFFLRTPRRAQLLEAFVPICGSALLFAALHSAVWPSPIPLFGLGLGLGWLAYRTHSLAGPFVVHGLFNAVATLVLAMSYADEMNGEDATTASRPPASAAVVKIVPGSQLPRLR